MSYELKTQNELIAEIEELKQKVATLETLIVDKYTNAAESDPFFNLSRDMFAIMNFDSRYVRINQAFAQNLGYEMDEILQSKAEDFVHPDDVEHNSSMGLQALAGRSLVNWESRSRHKDGTYRWLNLTLVPLVEARLLYVVGRDITERKAMEASLDYFVRFQSLILKLSNSLVSALSDELDRELTNGLVEVTTFIGADRGFICMISEDSDDPFIISDTDADYAEQQSDFINVFPVRKSTWSYRQLKEGKVVYISDLHTLPEDAKTERDYMESQGYTSAILVPVNNNETLVGVLGFASPHNQQNWSGDVVDLLQICGRMFINAWQRNIALQEQRAAEQLRAELEKEREISNLRKTLLSMASHDLRTPLASIRLSVHMIQKDQVRTDMNKFQTYLNRIEGNIDRQVALLDEVSIALKSQESRLRFSPQPGNIKQFCQSIIDSLENRIADNQNLHFVCDDIPESVLFDESLLNHIIVNLLTNAIKYSSNGGTILFNVRISDDLVVEVKDEGLGISPEDQKQLFKPYFRSKSVRQLPGTGLGLKIVYDCVTLHQGTISVESQLGVGSTFSVTLPVTYEDDPEVKL